MEIDKTHKLKNVLIIGLGGIGEAIVKVLKSENPQLNIYGVARQNKDIPFLADQFNFNLLEEAKWDNFSQTINHLQFDLIICTVGFLHNEEFKPEKKLDDMNLEHLTYSLQVNTGVHALALKYLQRHIPLNSPALFVSLTAKLGSIADNRMGGWYSYRMSKAALNMLIKNASIELGRKYKKLRLIAIHPGTTDTQLSAPYTDQTNLNVKEPKETALAIIKAIFHSPASEDEIFLNWTGEPLPW